MDAGLFCCLLPSFVVIDAVSSGCRMQGAVFSFCACGPPLAKWIPSFLGIPRNCKEFLGISNFSQLENW